MQTRQQTGRACRRRQTGAGTSLTELMCAMAAGLVVLGATLQALSYFQHRFMKQQYEVAQQQDLRLGFEVLEQELRLAGSGSLTITASDTVEFSVNLQGLSTTITAASDALKSAAAPVTGQSYDQMSYAQDRWTEYWIGGIVSVIAPPPGQGTNPSLPENVHLRQYPTPGVRLDQWDYDSLKKVALRWGTYYRLDHAGQLHPQGASDLDQGIPPAEALESPVVGDHRGMVFIDTMDGQPPRVDNMGTLVLDTDYVEGIWPCKVMWCSGLVQ